MFLQFLSILGFVPCIVLDAHQTGQRATCKLIGSVKGTLILEEVDGKLKIEGKLSNITLGKHAIHIHESGKRRRYSKRFP